MRRIRVDCTKVHVLGRGNVAERAKYAELSNRSRRRVPAAQDTDDQAPPLWVVDVLVDDPDPDTDPDAEPCVGRNECASSICTAAAAPAGHASGG